jgi:hypothetical protein
VPRSGAAAIRGEMKAHLEAAVDIPLAYLSPNSVKSVNPKSRFQGRVTIVPIVSGNSFSITLFLND